MICNNTIISDRNNQAISQESLNVSNDIINTLTEWYNRGHSKIDILNYLIRNISCYGLNSHPSQTTIGRHAGVQRGWVNIVTNELVEMGLITKTRVIINGDEMACEYTLTRFFQDPKVRWMLKDILPALKLLSLFYKKQRAFVTDNTPYLYRYIKNNFKIVFTKIKSISRKQLIKISKMKEEDAKKERLRIVKQSHWVDYKEHFTNQHRKVEQAEALVAASQDEGFVNFLQGLLNGI